MIFGGKRKIYLALGKYTFMKSLEKLGKFYLSDLSASAPYKDGKIVSDALSRALKTYSEIYIPAGKYYIDRSLIVPSDTKIYADEHAEIILIKGVKTLLLRNENVIDGSDNAISEDAPCDKNIAICGGVWGEENKERLGYGASGRFDENDTFHGVSTCFLFSGVRGLTLKNLTFRSTAGFACQIGRVSDFAIENIRFENCFADGLHVNGGVKNGVIKNLSGHTEDDLIALNAYDWDNSSINFGAIENLEVDGVHSESGINAHKSFRIQPGVYPYQSGEKEDCYIKNLTVKNVSGVTTFKMYLQTSAYTDFPEKEIGVGRIENAVFENISADTVSPVDKQPNYLNGNPVTGNFATFEIGSNVKNLRLINVNAKLNREKYPNSYFMTVGPKSQYIAEKKLELFDPYVSCTAENITYKNIRINNRLTDDLSVYVKVVEFDRLYPSKLPFGKGKIVSIEREK